MIGVIDEGPLYPADDHAIERFVGAGGRPKIHTDNASPATGLGFDKPHRLIARQTERCGLGRVDRTTCTKSIHPPLTDLLRLAAARGDFNSGETGGDTPVWPCINLILPPIAGRKVRSFIPWKIALAGPIYLNLSESPEIPWIELNIHARNRAGGLR